MTSRARIASGILGVAGAAAIAAGGVTASAAAPIKHDGPVLSKESNGARSFRIKDDETGRRIRFRVNRRTQFERIPGGFSGLKGGLVVSVDGIRRDDGSRIARFVERERQNDD